MNQGSRNQPPPQLPGATPAGPREPQEYAATWFKAGKRADGTPLWPRYAPIPLLVGLASFIIMITMAQAQSSGSLSLGLQGLGIFIGAIGALVWWVYSWRAAAWTAGALVAGVLVLAIGQPEVGVNETIGMMAFLIVISLIIGTIACYQTYPFETGIVLFICGAWFIIKFAAHHFEVRREQERHQLARDIVDAQNGNTHFWRP